LPLFMMCCNLAILFSAMLLPFIYTGKIGRKQFHDDNIAV
jgi:hypothetical protein